MPRYNKYERGNEKASGQAVPTRRRLISHRSRERHTFQHCPIMFPQLHLPQEEAGDVVETRPRVGARRIKITNDHKNFLEQRITENPGVTLTELQAKLELEMALTVFFTTVSNAVNDMMYSYKKMHHEPATMNSVQNMEKRRNFLRTLTEAIRNGKSTVWQGETNFNVRCTRSTRWSFVGRRAVAVRRTSKPACHWWD